MLRRTALILRHSRRGLQRRGCSGCGRSWDHRMLPDIRQLLTDSIDAVERHMLREISGEREVQRPSQRHAQLLLEGGQLGEVDRPPQPPGDESGEAHPKDLRHSSVMPDRCELTQSRSGRCFPCPTNRSHDVFAQRTASRNACCAVGGCGLPPLPFESMRNHQRPDAGNRHFQCLVDNEASLFLLIGRFLPRAALPRSPDQSLRGQRLAVV